MQGNSMLSSFQTFAVIPDQVRNLELYPNRNFP